MWVIEARGVPEGFRVGYNDHCLLCETQKSFASYTFSGKLSRIENQLDSHIFAEGIGLYFKI